MNSFQASSCFNEPIVFFDNTISYQNKEFLNCNHFPVGQLANEESSISIMSDGKPAAAADEFGVGGSAKSNMVPLPFDFIPGRYDVLCGRGKKNYNSFGTLGGTCFQ